MPFIIAGLVYGAVVLMVAALFTRYSRGIRSCANLLPITMVVAFLAYKYLVGPSLPGHYSDLGFFVTWGCILSPFPLVLIVTYLVSRLPGLYQVASSPWWMGLYGAVTAVVVFKMFFLS